MTSIGSGPFFRLSATIATTCLTKDPAAQAESSANLVATSSISDGPIFRNIPWYAATSSIEHGRCAPPSWTPQHPPVNPNMKTAGHEPTNRNMKTAWGWPVTMWYRCFGKNGHVGPVDRRNESILLDARDENVRLSSLPNKEVMDILLCRLCG
jgi:hypothetical protein